jgi:hypothetical protein
MIEDVEIATRFVGAKSSADSKFVITGIGDAYTLASAVSETLSNIKLVSQPDARIVKWSDLVNQERELWPIDDLLPGGAYIH